MFDDLRREFALMRNLESGTLIIGSDPATTEALLAPAFRAIVGESPKLHFELRDATGPYPEASMLEKETDLYIGLKRDRSLKAFAVVDLELPPLTVLPARPPITRGTGHPR